MTAVLEPVGHARFVAAGRYELPRVPTRHREWRTEASCTQANSEMFFPIGKDGETRSERADRLWMERTAMRMCEGCPVRPLCARAGIELAQQYRVNGIWAGVRFTGGESRAGLVRKLDLLKDIIERSPETWER